MNSTACRGKAFSKSLVSDQSLSKDLESVTLSLAPSEFLLTGDGETEKSLLGNIENLLFLPPDCLTGLRCLFDLCLEVPSLASNGIEMAGLDYNTTQENLPSWL